MQYRYRVVGTVEHSFILRGAFFSIGSTINFYIAENELAFIKERCKLEVIEDISKSVNADNSISSVAKENALTSENNAVEPQTVSVKENAQPTANKPVKRQYTKRSVSVSNK